MARNDLTEQVLFLLGCESELADQHFSIPEVYSQLLIRKNSKKDWLTGGLPLPLPPPRLPRFLPRGITFHLMYLLQYLKRFRLNIGIWGHTKVVFRHLFKESLYNIHLVCSLYFVVAVYHYKLPRLSCCYSWVRSRRKFQNIINRLKITIVHRIFFSSKNLSSHHKIE
jgi:hypothetical protein